MNRLEERVADQEIDTAVWEGVRAVFERRHGSGTCPNDRLSDLKHANRDGETWQEYVVSARAAISAYISALESQGLKIVTEDQLKDTMAKGWNACRTSVYALSENTLERISEDPTAVQRGMKTEAKRFARSLLSMEAEDDNNFTEAYAAMLNAVEE